MTIKMSKNWINSSTILIKRIKVYKSRRRIKRSFGSYQLMRNSKTRLELNPNNMELKLGNFFVKRGCWLRCSCFFWVYLRISLIKPWSIWWPALNSLRKTKIFRSFSSDYSSNHMVWKSFFTLSMVKDSIFTPRSRS
jgi:hypothetical protein